MPWQDVCLSVRLSVRHTPVLCLIVYVIHMLKVFSPSGSRTIVVFRTKQDGNILTETPLMGALNAREYEKSRFSTNIGLYLGTDAR